MSIDLAWILHLL